MVPCRSLTFAQDSPPPVFVNLKSGSVTQVHMIRMEASESLKGQMGPCGIACGLCDLGNGNVAGSARKVKEYLQNYGVSQWAPMVPGGSDVDFDQLFSSLDWVSTHVSCLGCERGGGPPDCTIRSCAKERGFEICSDCPDLEECDKFDWLGSTEAMKSRLRESKGKTKQELIDEALAKTR